MSPQSLRAFVQGTFSVIYLTLIILTIPLAFDVGGEDCGIAFTFTLSAFYFVMSTIRILTRNTKFSIIGSLLYYLQHIITPSLLILHLGFFSNNEAPATWLSVIEPWGIFIKNATPIFTCLEGFCTLLVIQATGQIMEWLNNKRSDSWIFVQLMSSALIITGSLYFLYRIYTFDVEIDLLSATLIGALLATSTFLGLYGIVSKRGSPIESSLLFAYVVYCLYVTYTDFQTSITSTSIMNFLFSTTSTADVATSSTASFFNFFSGKSQTAPPVVTTSIPPLPPIIVTGYTNMVATIAELVPQGFITVFDFLKGAVSTITPSVAVSLAYRLAVFYGATRIIPALQEPRTALRKPHSKTEATLFVVYAYAPGIIIAVYSNLLMQHFGILGSSASKTVSDATIANDGFWNWVLQHWSTSELSWKFWGWVNMFSTLAFYALELIYGKETNSVVPTEHYKQD